jgi:hypothetical protein
MSDKDDAKKGNYTAMDVIITPPVTEDRESLEEPPRQQLPPDLSKDYVTYDSLPRREVHLVSGPSGVGKTTFLCQLMDDVQNGRSVLECQAYPAPYCYVSLDRSQESINRTLDRLGLTGRIKPIIALPDLKSRDRLKELLDLVPSETRVVFIEGFGLLVSHGDSNDYTTVAQFLSGAVRLCQERGITIIGTVHTSKIRARDLILLQRERILGSVAWGAYSDTIIHIEHGDVLNVHNADRRIFVLPRNAPSRYFDYVFEERGRLVPAVERLRRELLDEKFDPLPTGTEVTRQQILAWAAEGQMSPRTAEYWIFDQLRGGIMEKKKRGVYTKTGPVLGA